MSARAKDRERRIAEYTRNYISVRDLAVVLVEYEDATERSEERKLKALRARIAKLSQHAKTVAEVLDATEAVIRDGEVDFKDVRSPKKAREAQLDLIAHIRDQLCDVLADAERAMPQASVDDPEKRR